MSLLNTNTGITSTLVDPRATISSGGRATEMAGKTAAETLKHALRSHVAIYIYLVIVAIALGVITGYYIVVPLLQQTCTIFDSRCVSVMVTKGSTVNGVSTLLVQVPSSGYSYYYDGRYIYSYGNGLSGQCPSIQNILQTQPSPNVQTVPVNGTNYCAHVKPDGSCEITPSLTCTKWADYDKFRVNQPVECTPGVDANCVCAPAITSEADSAGSDSKSPEDVCLVVKPYTCDAGKTWGASPCCDTQPACPPTETCTQWSTMSTDENSKSVFTCPGSDAAARDYNFCCECSTSIEVNLTPLTSVASLTGASAMEPVFAVNAATMELLPANNGIYCAKKLGILLNNDFRDGSVQRLKLSVPANNNEFNIYQVFEILKKKGIFKVEPGSPASAVPAIN